MFAFDPFRIAAAHLELWNHRNPKLYKDLLAPTATARFIWDKEERPAPAVLDQYENLLHTAVPDVKVIHTNIIPTGSTLVLEFLATGTHKGTIFEIPPTGRRGEVRGTTVLMLNEDGKIVKETTYLDLATLMKIAGLLPKPVDANRLAKLPTDYIAAINRHDINAVNALLAPDFTAELENGKVLTREEHQRFLLNQFVMVPDLKAELKLLAVRNPEAFVECLVTGKMNLLPPVPVKVEVAMIFSVMDDKIHRIKYYLDMYTLLVQQGRVPEKALM